MLFSRSPLIGRLSCCSEGCKSSPQWPSRAALFEKRNHPSSDDGARAVGTESRDCAGHGTSRRLTGGWLPVQAAKSGSGAEARLRNEDAP